MDPNATWSLVIDDQLDDDERAFAALNLLVWLAKGGALPSNVQASTIRGMHDHVVATCEAAVVARLDSL